LIEFIQAVRDFGFLQVALLSGLLASVSCGIIGSYVVVRRISYMAGGIAHCVLGGMGAARYFAIVYRWDWLHPLYGAIVAALLAAMIIGIVSLRAKQREDTVIGALWAIGMAIGVVFIARTPGYSEDLMAYLFGNILMVTDASLYLLVALDVVVVAVGLLLYNQLQAVCFDEEFARIRGLNVELLYLLLLGLTALTVVLLVSVVGIVLVIALLTLPVAVASHFCRTLFQMMLAAAGLSMVFTTAGLALSYEQELPPGATTILLAASVYVVLLVAARLPIWRRTAE
jgi:zinc transport system permease protein